MKSDMGKNQTRYRVFDDGVKSPEKITVVYDDGELVLHGLNYDGTPVLNITFDYVLLTRICPESVRLKLVSETQTYVGLILIDEESELISWLSEQDLQITNMQNFKHYIFFLANEVVDVIAQGNPHIQVV